MVGSEVVQATVENRSIRDRCLKIGFSEHRIYELGLDELQLAKKPQ
jgi:hypothetical protein